jgi:hypothetical protein
MPSEGKHINYYLKIFKLIVVKFHPPFQGKVSLRKLLRDQRKSLFAIDYLSPLTFESVFSMLSFTVVTSFASSGLIILSLSASP